MNAVVKSLKTEKASGKDDVRPEMLKAMNMPGVRWLTRVCKVVRRTGQAPKQRQTSVVIPIHKKEDKRKCTNYGAKLSSVSRVRSMLSARGCKSILKKVKS